MTSVIRRIKAILKERVRFATGFKSVEAICKIGHSDDDKIWLATALFNKFKVQHLREEVGKPFKFLKCWEMLRDLPNFSAGAGGASSSEGDTMQGRHKSAPTREMQTKKIRSADGRRKAKEDLADQHMRAKKIKLAEAAVRL